LQGVSCRHAAAGDERKLAAGILLAGAALVAGGLFLYGLAMLAQMVSSSGSAVE